MRVVISGAGLVFALAGAWLAYDYTRPSDAWHIGTDAIRSDMRRCFDGGYGAFRYAGDSSTLYVQCGDANGQWVTVGEPRRKATR